MGLAVVNNNLIAIGGFDGANYLKSVEIFDPEQQQWKQCSSMIYRRLGGGVGVVKLDRDSILLNNKSSVSTKDSKSNRN